MQEAKSAGKNRATRKHAEVVATETTEVCSLVTLISFYTTRTFNHESTCIQPSPVGTLLASAPCLQTAGEQA